MKLFSTWTRELSIGIALAAISCPVSAQGPAYPMPSAAGEYGEDPSYGYGYGPEGMPSDGMPPGASCDASCDAYSTGNRGRFLGIGRDLKGRCQDGMSGMGGGGPGGGSGCGPLGCEGGTFGDGRSLSGLCSSIAQNIFGFGFSLLTPYGEGGVAAQRWFDISAEAVVLHRDNGAGQRAFSSQGQAPDGPEDFVLSTDDVEFDQYRVGLGLQANVQVGPGSNVEVVYFGLNKWDASATVTSTTPTLYSFFSDFGTNPASINGDDGFDDPDRSFSHTINYESQLNNGEVNLRRRWAEPSGFFQGSYLAGIRYFQLDEEFAFIASGENNDTAAANGPRFFQYDSKTRNQMTGFQIGSDLWANLIPGVKVGVEAKGGIFGNHATQHSSIFANSLVTLGVPSIAERASDGRTAYLAQASAQAIYRLTYSWTLRGSYQVLYVDNVALAPENVNDEPPGLFLPGATRNIRIDTDGEVFYTGFTGGVEYNW